MSGWSREHDAVIARVAEGFIVKRAPMPVDPNFYACFPPGKPAEWRQLYHYSTDINAIARAVEAWRTSDDDIDRTIQVYSAVERMDLPFRAECCENYLDGDKYEWRTFKGKGGSYCEALAWALYEAVKGTK